MNAKKIELSENPLISNDGDGNSFSVLVKKVTNSPLPWFGILALVTIFMAWEAGQAKQAAFNAETSALLAEQHFKDHEKSINDRLKATDEYIEKLRFEMASHGLIPPPQRSKDHWRHHHPSP